MVTFEIGILHFIVQGPLLYCAQKIQELHYNSLVLNSKMSIQSNICFLLLFACFQGKTQAAAPLMQDNKVILNVTGLSSVGLSWSDSYSVGNSCYCESTFDHGIGDMKVKTPLSKSPMTIRQVCDLLGPGPGSTNRPKYNDIQCGNGPPYNSTVRASDEIPCPGRVEYGIDGCKYIGPKWNFKPMMPTAPSPTAPVPAPKAVAVPTPTYAVSSDTLSQVVYFNWWNAGNNTVIAKMKNNEKLCRPKYDLGIEAIAKNALQPISIAVSGAMNFSKIEGKAPYYAFGNQGSDVYGKQFLAGNYTITAYPTDNADLGRLTVKVQIVDC